MARILCLGHAVQDLLFSVESLPDRGEKYRASACSQMGGGPAATAAVAIVRLGGEASLITRLGDDPIADLITAELAAYGVELSHVRRFPGCRSSLSSVCVDRSGERMIVNFLDPAIPDACDWLTSVDIRPFAACLADCRWPKGATALLDQARKHGIPAILDADMPLAGQDGLIRAASHIAFSQPGLADYCGKDDPEAMLAMIARKTGAWCCVTLGAAGTLVHDQRAITHFPAPKVTVRDTLGAGDVWHGAFALALGEGKDEPDAVRFANRAAAIKVSRPGGRAGVPSRADLEAFPDP
ncbi:MULTISPECIES: PfkB family carbohydrate kinase [unclassified Iodidimonas]|jgi:sulfofructose kinase|uniref:PfkB family carbohydrate kinase n=1 Tax=unclassified Iodidimonas TaxID=2626145 RepID=UPI00248264E1|nr:MULTISPECIES: PfkB family carbohydrate kinase [unclassified Iodidimonas]